MGRTASSTDPVAWACNPRSAIGTEAEDNKKQGPRMLDDSISMLR
jgi:hypothetical protein